MFWLLYNQVHCKWKTQRKLKNVVSSFSLLLIKATDKTFNGLGNNNKLTHLNWDSKRLYMYMTQA